MDKLLQWEFPSGIELIKYARRNPKLIRIKYKDNLIKLNYSKHTQAKQLWNPFTVMCRGIILDTSLGTILAYPFRKFFNKFELKKFGIKLPNLPYEITPKYDGIMIIPFPHNEKLCLSTRGEFQNEYTKKAQAIQYFDWLDLEQFTFIFELISPSFSRLLHKKGFLITKYEKDDLILVGMRDNHTHKLLMPSQVVEYAQKNDLHHFPLLNLSLEQILNQFTQKNHDTFEGWVINYENGLMVKLKRKEYLDLFSIVKEINEKTILRVLQQNKYLEYKQSLPEELISTAERISNTIIEKRDKFISEILVDFNNIPSDILADKIKFFAWIKQFKKYKKSKQKNKAYASTLRIYYTKRIQEALWQHFYRYIYPQRLF